MSNDHPRNVRGPDVVDARVRRWLEAAEGWLALDFDTEAGLVSFSDAEQCWSVEAFDDGTYLVRTSYRQESSELFTTNSTHALNAYLLSVAASTLRESTALPPRPIYELPEGATLDATDSGKIRLSWGEDEFALFDEEEVWEACALSHLVTVPLAVLAESYKAPDGRPAFVLIQEYRALVESQSTAPQALRTLADWESWSTRQRATEQHDEAESNA